MQPIGRLGKIGSWFLVVAHTAVLAPGVLGKPLLLNSDCCQPAPETSGPAVWGFVGLTGSYFDSLEIRASAYSFNNLNRGSRGTAAFLARYRH